MSRSPTATLPQIARQLTLAQDLKTLLEIISELLQSPVELWDFDGNVAEVTETADALGVHTLGERFPMSDLPPETMGTSVEQFIVADIADSIFGQQCRANSFQSIILFHLTVNGNRMGYIVVYLKAKQPDPDAEMELLAELISTQVSFLKLQAIMSQQQDDIYPALSELAIASNYRDQFLIIAGAARNMMLGGAIYIAQPDAETGGLSSIDLRGSWGQTKGLPDKIDLQSWLMSLAQDRPHYLPDMTQLKLEPLFQQIVDELGLRTCVVIPLQTGGEWVGFVVIYFNKVVPKSHLPMRFFEVMAIHAGTIISMTASIIETQDHLYNLNTYLLQTVDNLPFIIFATNEEGNLVMFEGKAAHAIGLDPNELISAQVMDAFIDYPPLLELVEAAFKGDPISQQLELGKRAFLVDVKPLVDEIKGITGVSGVLVDVTESEMLMRRFLATMNHELRQPLSNVNSATIMIAKALTKLQELLAQKVITPDELRKPVERIKDWNTAATSNSQILRELVDMLLFNAKLQAGRITINPVPIDLRNWFHELKARFASRIEVSQLHLTVAISEKVPPTVDIDSEVLLMIVNNLLSNAIKFTAIDGSVIIRIEYEGGFLTIQVEDTGIGIAPENLERIWQEFTQEDEKINRKYGGTGLGLSLISQLVALHNGERSVDSTQGVGSTFTVRLPMPVEGG